MSFGMLAKVKSGWRRRGDRYQIIVRARERIRFEPPMIVTVQDLEIIQQIPVHRDVRPGDCEAHGSLRGFFDDLCRYSRIRSSVMQANRDHILWWSDLECERDGLIRECIL